ncbi:MAG: hypothetical protein CFE25_18170 [Chitinophagaceae bacterium BSSC1]|nr:MAG: hypothetical protein CFE25_18170 [Chitinophagaceae bacterium BSSC1]
MKENNLQTPGVYINEINVFAAQNYIIQPDSLAVLDSLAFEMNQFFRAKYLNKEDLVIIQFPVAIDGSTEINTQNKILICPISLEPGKATNSFSGFSLLVMSNFANPLESLKIIQACGDFLNWIAPNGKANNLKTNQAFSIQATAMDMQLQQQIFLMLGCLYKPAILYKIHFKDEDFTNYLQLPNPGEVNQELIKNCLESDINNLLNQFVFEPNHQGSWLHIRYWANKILDIYWKRGFLIGKNAEDAFQVSMDINSTMTAQDLMNGTQILSVRICLKEADWLQISFTRTVSTT